MSQRRSPAVRRQAKARRTIRVVAARPAGVLLQRSDAPFLDEDGGDAGLGAEVGREPAWPRADGAETGAEVLGTEERSRRAPTAGVDAAGTPGTARLILRYVQEAGTVPLLTAADEVRLAEPWPSAKAHRLERLQAALPAAAMPPELTPEAWLAEQLRQRPRGVARLDQGPAAAVEADSGRPPAAVRHLWAMRQPVHEQLEATTTEMITANLRLVVAIAKRFVNRGLPAPAAQRARALSGWTRPPSRPCGPHLSASFRTCTRWGGVTVKRSRWRSIPETLKRSRCQRGCIAARAEESKRNPRLSCLPTEVEGIEVLAELALDRRWLWNHAADHVW